MTNRDIENMKNNIDELYEKLKEREEENVSLVKAIADANNRHQSDCITINQLQTTIDVLVDKLARLREIHGL